MKETEQQCLVTVSIMCFNSKRHLDSCLNSLLDQDFPYGKFQIVLFDNGSSDGSPEYVEQHFPTVRVVRFDKNYGIAEGANRIVAQAETRYVAFINADCVAHRRWLAELYKAMQADPLAKLAQSTPIQSWFPEYAAMEREKLTSRAYVVDIWRTGNYDYQVIPLTENTEPICILGAQPSGLILDTTVVSELGYLADPEYFAYAEDLDMSLRINLLGYHVLLVPKSIIYHNSDWTLKRNWWTVKKAMLSARNTILTFYKLSYWSELVVLMPLVLLGNLEKARQHALSPWLGRVYWMLAIPQTLLALLAALWLYPRYRVKRQFHLRQRKYDRNWLRRELLKRPWHASSDVWLEQPQKQQTYASGASEAGEGYST